MITIATISAFLLILFAFSFPQLRTQISAKIIAASVNPDGDCLYTVEATFNRWILAELNTHRMLSRNSASSRAIPVKRLLKAVLWNPAYPVQWGSNKPGMQAGAALVGWRLWCATRLFFAARIPVLVVVSLLSKLGLHKQVSNRLLEPWTWHVAIVSATEWDNFFKLRCHPDAQPEFQVLARCILGAMRMCTPRQLAWNEWHTPYLGEVERVVAVATTEGPEIWRDGPAKISAACCARVSYVRQNDRKSVAEDVAFCDRLSGSGHYSPLEHPAQAVPGQHANYHGFRQLRRLCPGEDGRNVEPVPEVPTP